MHPTLVIALAAAAALPLGLWLRHNLNQLGYRNADEQDLPHPGPRWWVVWASVLAAAGTCAAAVLRDDPLPYLPITPLVISGPWLAAADFDVTRIPNRILAPTAAATILVVVGIAAAGQGWRALIVPLVAALTIGIIFAAVHFFTEGGIGFGDVKLATLIALALGSLGIGAVWLSVLAGSVATVVWAKAGRRAGPIPYGPWLLCGTWIAVLAVPSTSGS